jgi:hypothetical protein
VSVNYLASVENTGSADPYCRVRITFHHSLVVEVASSRRFTPSINSKRPVIKISAAAALNFKLHVSSVPPQYLGIPAKTHPLFPASASALETVHIDTSATKHTQSLIGKDSFSQFGYVLNLLASLSRRSLRALQPEWKLQNSAFSPSQIPLHRGPCDEGLINRIPPPPTSS